MTFDSKFAATGVTPKSGTHRRATITRAAVCALFGVALCAGLAPQAQAKKKAREADPPECEQIIKDLDAGHKAINAAVGDTAKSSKDVDNMVTDLDLVVKKLAKTCKAADSNNRVAHEQWKKQLKERKDLALDCTALPKTDADTAQLTDLGLSNATDHATAAVRGLVPFGSSLNPGFTACLANARAFIAKKAAPTAECSAGLVTMSAKLKDLDAYVKATPPGDLLDGYNAEKEKFKRAFSEVKGCQPANTVEFHAKTDTLFERVRAVDAHNKAKQANEQAISDGKPWSAAGIAANACILTAYQVHDPSADRNKWISECSAFRDAADKNK